MQKCKYICVAWDIVLPRQTTVVFSEDARAAIRRIKGALELSTERFVSITEMIEWLLLNAPEQQMIDAFEGSTRGQAKSARTSRGKRPRRKH